MQRKYKGNLRIRTKSRRLIVMCILTATLSCLMGCLTDSESGSKPSSTGASSSSKPANSSSSAKQLEPITTIDGISLLVDSSFFMDKFHSSFVKIAFNDDETNELNYIEIDGNTLKHEIIPTPGVPNHPQFSPDGSKLAFSTGLEGIPILSELYVIDLASSKRSTYKIDVESAAIPRWRILENGDTAILYNDFSGSNQDARWANSGTYLVTYSNNSFGTPQKIFNRSYNGGVASDHSLAATGAPRLLFHYAADNDSVNTDMYNDEQVCNVSLARDTNKIISFLETRGTRGVEFTQDPQYNWHQYIFYMDYTGNILKAIKTDNSHVFNGTEWIFVPGFQVSTLATADGLCESIALIDYVKSSYSTIIGAPGKQISNPDLWVSGY